MITTTQQPPVCGQPTVRDQPCRLRMVRYVDAEGYGWLCRVHVGFVRRDLPEKPDPKPTGSRQRCPTSDLWGDRHDVTGRRWSISTPDGATVDLCSAACALAWITYGLPADLEHDPRAREAGDATLRRSTTEAA